MIGFVRQWLLGIAAASLLSALAMAITPEGRVKRIVNLVCSFVVAAAMIAPLAGFDFGSFSVYVQQYRAAAEEMIHGMEEENSRLNRLIIEEKSAAYILDKAESMDTPVSSVSVNAKWNADEKCWYPYSAKLSFSGPEEARAKIAWYLSADLGIPEERQEWSTDENSLE